MKLINIIIILGIIFITISSCDTAQDTSLDDDVPFVESQVIEPIEESNSLSNYNFEQVGYYKGDNKLRYFTFYVKSNESINPNSIPQDFINAVKDHGSNQTNTSGQITASFYYLDKANTPDITSLTASRANDLAHNKKPIIAVWIMPNGNVNLMENPE
jgi:uncharacterized protein YxeA